MNAADIIGVEKLKELRAAGFVVIHQQPTKGMYRAALSALGRCEGCPRKAFHRMVGESIRKQRSFPK